MSLNVSARRPSQFPEVLLQPLSLAVTDSDLSEPKPFIRDRNPNDPQSLSLSVARDSIWIVPHGGFLRVAEPVSKKTFFFVVFDSVRDFFTGSSSDRVPGV
jgi:hypothetical protein